jgi:hypothetical protein
MLMGEARLPSEGWFSLSGRPGTPEERALWRERSDAWRQKVAAQEAESAALRETLRSIAEAEGPESLLVRCLAEIVRLDEALKREADYARVLSSMNN